MFFDPRKIEFRDASHSDHEERYLTIGNAFRKTILLVIICSTEKSGRIRLISARRVTKAEEGIYYGE
ncbi:MAG: BrnT family toxin [Sphaerochaeta sp.]